MAGMKQDGQKALDAVRMLTEADSDSALRENFRKVAALFGVEDMLREEAATALAPTADFSSASSALPTSLPDAPPQYFYKPRMKGGIEKYLRDNWVDYIKAGLLSRPALRKIDPTAAQALTNWLRINSLPSDLHLLSKSELVNRELAQAPLNTDDARRYRRLQRAAARRKNDPKPE